MTRTCNDITEYIREINHCLRKMCSGFYTIDGVTLKRVIRYEPEDHQILFTTKSFASPQDCLTFVLSIQSEADIDTDDEIVFSR